MSRDVRIEAAARDELAAAVEWYEEQRPGLGDELLDEVEASLQQISSAPLVNLAVPGCPPDSPARRVLIRRFPYSVVYLLTDAEIHVIAFAHAKRRPGYWRNR